jgi:TrpR family transcriptional regulator, trp operon repressor
MDERPGWQLFLRLVKNTEDNEQLNQLFQFLLTPEECEHIITRIELVRELLQGKKTQREIAKDLNISIAKITRGSNNLKKIDDQFKSFLKQILES